MAKNSFDFSSHSGSLDSLERYYRSMSDLIDRKHDPKQNPRYTADFIGMRPEDVSAKAGELRRELTFEGNMAVLSHVESLFRVDAIIRCQANQKRDNLCKRFRTEIRMLNNRKLYHFIRLNETILDGWKEEYSEHTDLLNTLGQAFEYRNWLAHGKYWTYKESPGKYTYEYVLHLAKDVAKAFGGLLYGQLPINAKIETKKI